MSDWREWQDAAIAKRGLTYPERTRAMLKMYGEKTGETCKDCAFMIRYRRARTYLKCSKNKMTRGTGTDWRAGWPACGLFEKGEKKVTHATY